MMSATEIASNSFIGYSTLEMVWSSFKNSDQPVYRYYYSKLRAPLAGYDCRSKCKTGDRCSSCMWDRILHGNLDLVKMWAFTPDDHKCPILCRLILPILSRLLIPMETNYRNGNPCVQMTDQLWCDADRCGIEIFNAMHDDRTRLLDKYF